MILNLLKRLTLINRLLFNYVYLKLIIITFFCAFITNLTAQILSDFPCYAVAEDNGAPNFFFEYDPTSESWTNVGVTGTSFIESIATDPVNNIIYAMDGGTLGTIDRATGAFSAIGTLGNADGEIGNILLDDVDGLSYDPANEILWASHRISGLGPGTNDLLFKIDPATASIIPDEFINDYDYVVVEEVFDSTFGGSVFDVDDIAYNPYTGILYAIQNQDGPGVITSINQFDGSVESIIIDFPDDDVEGLGITYLSELYGTTGDNGSTGSQNTFIFIDIANSSTKTLSSIDPSGNAVDFESFDCLTAVNDLALQKEISTVQAQPIFSGDVVTYNITVFNQGDIPNENIEISDYIPMGLSLADQDWNSLSPQLASYTIPGPLNPGESITFDIQLQVGPTATGTITNYAEISLSFNENINIANGEDTPLPDIDSEPNSVNDEAGDVIVDDQINGSGPNANQDEDDHDVATFSIGNCIAAGAEYFPCYSVAENNGAPNTLYLFDQAQNIWTKIGSTGTTSIEAIAADPVNEILYAVDGGTLGRLNVLNGTFTSIGTLGTANGEAGPILINDVDGLTFDPINNELIGSHRVSGTGPGTNDLLVKINPLTGALITSAFIDTNGNPADYAVIEEAFDSTVGSVVYDIEDIALNPYNGELFVIQNQNGPGLITIINSVTGEIDAIIYDTSDDNLRGLGFNGYGELFATSGEDNLDPSQNSFIVIDYLNTTSTVVSAIDPTGEDVNFESFDCFAGYNDLALRQTLLDGQESPFCTGETVTFEIEVFNQGLLTNENILITNYFSNEFELVDGLWTDQGNGTATINLDCPLSPGQSEIVEISFQISNQVACSENAELTIDNFSEITVSFNPFYFDETGLQIPLPDIDSNPDFLNNETDVVDNEINQQAVTGDEDDHDIESITVSPANPSAGTLSASSNVICSLNDATIISASPNGNILQGCFTATNADDIIIPDGYELVYVLTEGTGLVIMSVSPTPSFTVSELGDYTIHSFVYNPNTLDTSTIIPGTTTGFDVNALLTQGGGDICADLNVDGASISVNNPSAGTLTAAVPTVCFNGTNATLEAASNNDASIPSNYSTIYVLTSGTALVIEAVDGNPQFTVTQPGDYTIHSLVYDPNTLDLSVVIPGTTTGFDVNALLIQGGGEICGALDVAGAAFTIQNPGAGSLTATSTPISCLIENEATLTAETNAEPEVPAGYEVLYVLTSGTGLVIESTATTPNFTVTQPGDYTIHTLVYNLNTLDLSTITPGQTTGLDVNALLTQGGGDICAALDVTGVPFNVGGNILVAFEDGSPVDATCGEPGAALIEISGGTAPYQVLWSDGFSLEDRPEIGAGNYSVNVTDQLGCTGSLDVTILGSSTLELAITETCELTVAGADAVLDYTLSGGSEPYLIEVLDATGNVVNPDEPGTSPVWNTLAEGQYNITVSDANDCSTSQSFVICPYSCQLEGMLEEIVNVNCNGGNDGSITISATTNQGADPITYVWLSGDGSIIEGETLPTLNNITAGTYEVRLEDVNGCTEELIFEITEPTALIFVDCNSEDVTTTEGMDGSATLIIDGGVAPYTYLWSDGQTANPAINLSEGTYDAVVTDANGCELQTTCTVQSPSCSGFNIDFNTTPVSCFDEADGIIEISATGVSGTVTYSWLPDVASGPLASNLAAGMYEVFVVDAVGCEETITAEILQPAALTGVIGKSDVVCFAENNGTLDLQASGGTAPYSYLWSNGSNTEDQTDIGPANYTVTVEDANGCAIVRSDEILEPTELRVSDSIITNVSCNGEVDGNVSVTVQGGSTPYQYSWSNGESTPTFSGYVAGTYSLTVVDNNGCSLEQDFEISEPDALTVIDCNAEDVTSTGGMNGTATMIISGGTAPYTYLWSDGQTTNPAVNLAAGTYNVEIEDANGCLTMGTCSIQEPSCAGYEIDIVNNIPVSCFDEADGSIEVSVAAASGSINYTWIPAVSNSALATGLAAGIYQIVAVDALGCEASASVEIAQPAELTGNLSKTSIACFGESTGSITSEINGGVAPYQYLWSNGVVTPNLENINPGSYIVTVTDDNGCVLTIDENIAEPIKLEFSQTNVVNVSCNSLNDGSITAVVEGGASPYTYAWSNGETTTTLTDAPAGSYSLTVNDSNNCTLDQDFEITEPEALTVISCNAEDVTTTEGMDGTATIVISGGTAPYSYQWSNGQTTNPAVNLAAGSYDVTVVDVNGCETQTTCTVQSPSCSGFELSVASIASTNCFEENDATVSVSVQGASGSIDYSWSPDVSTGPVATNLSAGIYEITAIDAVGCQATITAEVTQPAELNAIISKTDIACFGDQNGIINVNVSGGTEPRQYLWSNGETAKDLVNVGPGTYTVTITDAEGCFVVLNEEILQPEELNIIDSETGIRNVSCNGFNDGSISVSAEGGVMPYQFEWSRGQSSQVFSGAVAGVYSLTVIDNNGCTLNKDFEVVEPSALSLTGCSSEGVTVAGGADGTAAVEITGGSQPYTYLWSNGQTTNPAVNLEAGDYGVTVTDANGCEIETNCTVQQPSCANYSITSRSTQNVSCFGGNDGIIEISVNGASGTVTYNWSGDVSSGSLATDLPAGMYEVMATDAAGCESSTILEITEPLELLGTTSITDVTCFEQANGSIDAVFSGGVAPYNYLWSNGSSVEDLENIGPGIYTLTVTDYNGCVLLLNDEVTEPAELSILFDEAVDLVNVSCNGLSDGSISLSVEGGLPPYTYTWSTGETTNAIENLEAGFYSVKVSDANDCVVDSNFELTEPEALAFIECNSEDVTTTEGSDGTATVIISGGTAPYTYLWSDGQTTNPAVNLVAGTYDVSVIDANGCETTGTCTVQGVSCRNFEVDVNINQVSCDNNEDGSIEVLVTGASGLVTFGWVPEISTTAVGSNLGAGSYAIQVSDAVGCTEIITAELNNPASINGSTTKTDVLCNSANDGSIDLQLSGGTPPFTYSWSNGATQEDLNNLSPGDYAVTVVDANGCIFIVSETIEEPSSLEEDAVVISNATCTENSVGAIDINITGGTLPYTYEWSSGETTEDINNLTPANYFVTVTDANECTFGAGYDVLEPTSCSSDLALIVELAPNGPTEFKEGDEVTFVISLVNQGEDDLDDVTIVDYFPTGLSLNDQFWTSIDDNTASLMIMGTLNAGSTSQFDITFTVDSGAPTGLLENYAEVASATNSLGDPYQDADSTPDTINGNDAGAVANTSTDNTFDGNGTDDEDDHDVAVLFIQSFDLALQTTLSGSPGTSPGEEFSLLVTIINQGSIDAYNIIVNQSITENLILNDPNWTQVGNVITTTHGGPLLAGESITIPVSFILAPTAEAGVLIVVSELGGATLEDGTPANDVDSTPDDNFANDPGGAPGTPSDNVIIGDGSGMPGSDNANTDEDDHDPVIIVVDNVLIDLELDVDLSPRFVFSGEIITWTINVLNKGPADATAVDILNQFGDDLTYLSDNSGGSYLPGTGIWVIGDLAVNESATVQIQTTVNGLRDMGLTSQVRSANEEDVDSTPNNSIESEDDQDSDQPQPFSSIIIDDPCNCENGIDVDDDGRIDFAYEGIVITSASAGENWILTSATGLVDATGALLSSANLENRGDRSYLLESYAYTDGLTGFSASFEEVETGATISISGDACTPCPVTATNNPPNIGPDQRTCTEPVTAIAICVDNFDPDGDNVSILNAETTFNCSIEIFNDTCFTYIPLPGLINVTDTITVTACDDGIPPLCDMLTVLVDIKEDCDEPQTCDSNPLLLDCTELITPLEICVDDFCKLDDDTEMITDAETIFNCSIDFLPGNCITYTPLPGINGVDTIFIYGADAFGVQDTIVAYIIVTEDCETYYEANNDNTETNIGEPVTINVLENDNNNSDCDLEDLKISIVTQPANGTATLNADGTIEYIPNEGFVGEDTFEYEVCCLSVCDVAMVTISVVDTAPPQANNDVASTNENEPVTINVLENDDPFFQNCSIEDLTIEIVSPPFSGSVVVYSLGSVVYTPNEGFNGKDSFEYEVCCNEVCDIAEVSITVGTSMANDDQVSTGVNEPVSINVLENDDPAFQNCESDDLSVEIVSPPFSGSVVVYSFDNIIYTPDEDFEGEDSFEYEVCCIDLCDRATVSIIVGGQNNPPVAVDDEYETLVDQPVTIEILDNDFDPDGDDIEVVFIDEPNNGNLIPLDDGAFIYVPDTGFVGVDSFTYVICDDDVVPLCDTATVYINVLGNNPPVIVNENGIPVDTVYATTLVDTPFDDCILTTDIDGDNITIDILQAGNNGMIEFTNDSCFVYTPNDGFVGTDTLVFIACDDGIPPLCDTVTYIIEVIEEDLIPTANPDYVTTEVNTPITIPILENDILEPGEQVTITVVEEPTNGTVLITGEGEIIYTPDPDYIGMDSFIYEVCDANSCDTAIVFITISNPLELVDDAYQTEVGVPISFDVCENDIFDGMIEVVFFSQPSIGTVGQIEDQGCEFTYIPNGPGTDCFFYVVENEAGLRDTADVCIVVTDIEPCDAPIANTLTPNGDGVNDVFSLDRFVECCNNPEVLIFNRWGGIVYDNKNVLRGDYWLGEHNMNAGGNNNELPDGTYFYCILCPDDDGEVIDNRGFIHLDRGQ